MALNFPTVGAQLHYWLSNIGAPFSGWTDSQGRPRGERGIDIGMPYHSAVYSVVAGPISG
jgi:hypothetical protein